MSDVADYLDIIEAWMLTFPPEFYFENPDTSNETEYPWIALHRHYLHTTALSMALGPIRPFMAKRMEMSTTPEIELKWRSDGVNYALRLMTAVHNFYQYVWTRDTTFHFVPFCIFDTAALLCSSILHDGDGSIPRRNDILNAIDLALDSLRRLSTATNTAKTPFDILRRLAAKVKPAEIDGLTSGPRKRHRISEALQPSVFSGHGSGPASNGVALNEIQMPEPFSIPIPTNPSFVSSIQAISAPDSADAATHASYSNTNPVNNAHLVVADLPQPLVGLEAPPAYIDMPLSAEWSTTGSSLGSASDHMGDLADLWDWQSLNLEFTENPMFAPQTPPE